VLGTETPNDDATSAVPVARRLLALAPSLEGGPLGGAIAERLAVAWTTGRSSAPLVGAIERALTMLADHELATSALAVRIACSVRPDPAAAIAAGLVTLSGRLHGSTAAEVVGLLEDATTIGAGPAIRHRVQSGQGLPGFGHSVYRNGDPRFRPLMSSVWATTDDERRIRSVETVLAASGATIEQLPNIDFALGSLLVLAELPPDAPLFAIARIAGLAAHHDEELVERPLRFRGLSSG
jgi:citrate synthase